MWKHFTGVLFEFPAPVTLTVGIRDNPEKLLEEAFWHNECSFSSSSLLNSSIEPKSEHSDGVKLDRDDNSLTEPLRESILSLKWESCSRNSASLSLICISCSSITFANSALFLAQDLLQIANDARFSIFFIVQDESCSLIAQGALVLLDTKALNRWSISLLLAVTLCYFQLQFDSSYYHQSFYSAKLRTLRNRAQNISEVHDVTFKRCNIEQILRPGLRGLDS